MTTLEELQARVLAGEDAMIQAIATLTSRVALLEPADHGSDSHPSPVRWADRATPDEWEVLVRWVDDLNRGYSLTPAYRINPCWPAHPGVVEELAAVHHAWIAAVIADEKVGPHPAEPAVGTTPAKKAKPATGGSEYTVWHDRSLWPFLDRIRTGVHRISMCRTEHVPESGNDLPAPTDTTLVLIAT